MKNIGILDPIGQNKNPLTDKPYEDVYITENEFEFPAGSNKFHKYSYKNISKIWTNLIVYKKRNEMISAIKKNQVTLIKAGTGVGKTVLVPKFALHAGDYKDNVICCIPKKIITKETADFAAKCLDVKLGEQVGYYYKGEKLIDQNQTKTLLTFTTIGSLFSRITGDDPELKDYKTIIIDEAHERSIQTDFTLLLIKQVLEKRKDLKLIIMSATIDLDKFRNFYKKFKFGEVDAGSETTFKIKDFMLKEIMPDWKKVVIKIIKYLLNKTKSGDILVFVRSGNDGRQLCNKLSKASTNSKYNPFCVELESKSSQIIHPVSNVPQSKYATHETLYKSHPDQSKNNPFTRKIVMSTNVAESSLTVKGVVYVIDSGLEFVSKFEPDTMARSLLDKFIPQSAVKQRRGRAGRTQPGICYHLYSHKQYLELNKYPTPDIQKTDLSNEFLDLLRMSDVGTIDKLKEFLNKLIDPPSPIFIKSGLHILTELGAIKDNKITDLGLMITKFRGFKPVYAKSIITSYFYECKQSMIDIIAVLVLTDSRLETLFTVGKSTKIKQQFIHKTGDHLTILNAIKAYNKYKYGNEDPTDTTTEEKSNQAVYEWCRENNLNHKILLQVKKKAIEITRTLNETIKANPSFTIKPKSLQNEESKLLFCIAHKTNIAKYVHGSVYQTIFPIKKREAKINSDSTLKKYSTNIIFDELFVSKAGYKFNIVSTIPS